MPPITSPHNARLKELRKLARTRERRDSGLFVAEGEDLVRAASAAGRKPVYGLRVAGVEVDAPGFENVDSKLLARVSALGSSARVVGVYEQRWLDAPVGPLCLYLHGVRDPGNVGTALRSALAFGASSVALGPGCADPHSPKAVRASMGAVFTTGLARVPETAAGLPDLMALPGVKVALAARAGEPLAELYRRLRQAEHGAGIPTCARAGSVHGRGLRAGWALTLLVGAEREGLPAAILDACEHCAHIPIAPAAESLNAAMAATVALYALYEVTREQSGRAGEATPAPSSRVRA